MAIRLTLACGCGALPARPGPAAQTATRVLSVAKKLEAEKKSKQAFDAYRQLAERFPNTPEGKKAAERLRQAAKKSGAR